MTAKCLFFRYVRPRGGVDFSTNGHLYDIIITSSTLQYIRGWRGVLKKLFLLNKGYFVLVRLSSGEMPTFTTRQSIIMSYGPHKGKYLGDVYHTFINRQELIRFFESFNYEVMLDMFYADYTENLKALPEPYNNACLRTIIFHRRK